MIVILFGVSGSGKTAIGSAVATKLGWPFIDADDLHSDSNREKMRSGSPLTDEDRQPWLQKLQKVVKDCPHDSNMILAFSGLKRAYRDFVRGSRNDVFFIYLEASFAVIEDRLNSRVHAYMPSSLLTSQFATLELPVSSPEAITVSVEGTLDESIQTVLSAIGDAQCRTT